MSKAQDKREHILATAVKLVLEQSVGQLTLDAVAAAAGVSKGGLLYHFASKEQLIGAMLEHYMQAFLRRVDAHMAADTEPRGRFLRAFVLATLEEEPQETGIVAAAISALAYHPTLLDQLRAYYAQFHKRASEDGVSADVAQVVMLAMDGWWYARMFGNYPQLDGAALQAWLFRVIAQGE
ncbi:MAG: TetR/AcrR family transcriptional regulator [Anaerolineae bacterium]|jgi:AcrR family transcriptional regulator